MKEPIIVIVGFLGAGKTTLLKRLVNAYLNLGSKPYVILNDYENANLDAQQFLAQLDSSQVSALNGSCICCSGVNELRSLVNSIPRRDKPITLIEANGTTDACTLMGFLGVGMHDHFLPPVQISVVDALQWQKRGQENELEANQIQVSSLIILNHADKASSKRLQQVTKDLEYLNPSAKIKSWEEFNLEMLSYLRPSENSAQKLDHQKSHWSSCSVDLPNPYCSEKLRKVLNELPSGILRVKGCTRLDTNSQYTFFEKIASGEVFYRPYTGELVSGPKLLTIGPGSDPEKIKSLINASNLQTHTFQTSEHPS